MSYYGDDFYNEPTEFETLVDEFELSLLNAVKEDYKSEMEKLRKENAELQEVKSRMKQIESERQREKYELEEVKRNAFNESKKLRLQDLLQDYKEKIYGASTEYTTKPKCEKCDDKREISFVTPLGRNSKERCLCGVSTITYVVKEREVGRLEHYRAESDVVVRYYDADEDSYIRTVDMYEPGTKFEDINQYRTYFESKEDCQAYCDWLTEREGTKC